MKRATIKSYDAGSHQASLQLAGSLAVWLDNVPVATDIPSAEVLAGRECALLMFTDDNPADSVIVTVHGAPPSDDLDVLGALVLTGLPAGATREQAMMLGARTFTHNSGLRWGAYLHPNWNPAAGATTEMAAIAGIMDKSGGYDVAGLYGLDYRARMNDPCNVGAMAAVRAGLEYGLDPWTGDDHWACIAESPGGLVVLGGSSITRGGGVLIRDQAPDSFFSIAHGLLIEAQSAGRSVRVLGAAPSIHQPRLLIGADAVCAAGYALELRDDFLLGPYYMDLGEISAPAAPPANRARLYAKDNGSGKTQLVVRFPTGAEQVIATEP